VPSRRPLGAAVVAWLLAASAAHADAVGDLEKAHSAYIAHMYDDAETRLRALLDEKTGGLKDPDNIADARMYLGAVLVEERRKDEANEVFEKLLLEKPDYTPDSLRVSSEAVNAFLDAQSRLHETLQKNQAKKVQEEQARKAKAELERQKAALHLAMLEKLATEERVVEHNSRWRALVPFGVGQFQNGDETWGWVFLSTEGLLAVGSVVGAAVSVYEEVQSNDALRRADLQSTAQYYHDNAYTAAVVTDVLAGGLLLTAIVGAVHAEVTFVPERLSIRKRVLPQVSLSPVFGPLQIGVSGRF
jgi:tetratricopeptide (TPR) repeat protein